MNRTLSAAALLPFALAACSSSPPYAALPIEDDAEALHNVVVADAELYDVIRVGRAAADRVQGSNQMKVMVPIRNIDDEPVEILVQVSFLDTGRMPIGDDTNRQVKLLGPGATIPLVFLSKQDTARDWVMRISWNK
jgi:hypothetical protein